MSFIRRKRKHNGINEDQLNKHRKFLHNSTGIPEWTDRYAKARTSKLIAYASQKHTKEKKYPVSSTPKNPDWKIKPLKKLKNYEPELTKPMKEQKIPGHPETTMIVAPIGSGKSTFIGNMLTKKEFYKDYFDEIYLMVESPDETLIANVPMLAKSKKKRVFFNCNPGDVATILKEQEADVKKKGRGKAKRCLVILDDCIGNTAFFYSRPVQTLIFNLRHFNCSVWITSQAYVGVRLRHRKQMLNVIILNGINASEQKTIVTEHQPSWLSKKQFNAWIDDTLKDEYSFLFMKKNSKVKRDQFRNTHFEVIAQTPLVQSNDKAKTPPNTSVKEEPEKQNPKQDQKNTEHVANSTSN